MATVSGSPANVSNIRSSGMATWQVWVTRLAYALTALLMLVLFAENFVFSEHLGLLGFREIDDLAFQISLRHIHNVFDSGHLRTIWQRNDYGYGWFYWFPLAVLTYPAYFLSKFQGIDWPLIVLPRQYSWAMGVGCLWLMRGILKQYRLPEWACATGVLLFALFPTFGYFCLRFGTVQAVTFFAMLSAYWAVKPNSRYQLYKVMAALAMAGAIKLSGLLIAPAAFGLALLRLPGASLPGQFKRLIAPCIVFAMLLFTLINPAFWSFQKQVFVSYFDNLKHFIEVTHRSDGLPNVLIRFYTGVFGTVISAIVQIALLLSILFNKFIPKPDKLIILISLLISALYLVLTVQQHLSIGFYFTVCSFLLILGVGSYLEKNALKIVFLVLIGLSVTDIKNRWSEKSQLQHGPYFQKVRSFHNELRLSNLINSFVIPPYKHILVDANVPFAINALTHANTCITYIYDNFSPANKYCDAAADYIIFDSKNSKAYLSKKEFLDLINKTDAVSKKQLLFDKDQRRLLEEKGRFDKHFYEKKVLDGRIILFSKKTS